MRNLHVLATVSALALCSVAKASEADEAAAETGAGADNTPTTTTNPQAGDLNIVPKLSIKTMGANPKEATTGEGEAAKRVFMCRIMGIARGIKAATGQDGDPVFGLTGQFEGTSAKGTFSSGVCYLPSGIQELIQDPLEAAINAGDKTAAITFTMDLFAVTASNKAGYSFAAELLSDAEREDPFKALRQAAAAKPLPLPAPATS